MRSIASATVLIVACGGVPESPSSLRSPRVLALLTETPEVHPGEPVVVEAIWFDPERRAASFRWWWCWQSASVDPLRCSRQAAVGLLVGDGAAATLPFGLPSPSSGEADALIMVEVIVDDLRVEAFRRVRVRADGPLRRPPSFDSVELVQGSTSLRVAAGEVVHVTSAGLCVRLTGSADANLGPLTGSFFATAGSFDPPRAVGEGPLSACWSSGGASTAGIWVVLRDAMGGARARSFVIRRAP